MQTLQPKRCLWLACGILMSAGLVTTQAYHEKVLANNPTAYWRLDDKAQVPAADLAKNSGSVGAAVDGFYLGAAAHPSPGALAAGSDTAVAVDATAGTVVSVPYSAALNPSSAFTVEVWFNPNVENAAGTLTCALASGQFGAPRSGWLIYQSDTGWNFRMYNQNGLNTSVNLTGGPAPVAGTWYHVVAVYDGTTAFVYVNGVQAASGAPTGYVPSAGGPLFIGGRSDSSFWWSGSADELAIYGKALSATEIDAHYQNGISASPATPYDQLILTSGPLGYYRLNEPAYTPPTVLPVAKNLGSSGAAGDGSYNPGVDAQVTGPRPPTYSGFEADNTAGGFNGSAGYVGTPFNLNDLTAFTVMGWLKRGAVHSGRGGYFGQNDLLEFGDADGGANIEAWINAYGTNIKIPYPFRDDEWGFIALVGDGTQATLYVNGLPASTITQTVDSYGSSAFNFNIGGGGIFNATGDNFLGVVDEVAVFDKALTAAQVQEIYYAANIAPIITSQPAAPARDVYVGNVVTLRVGAAGTPPLRYQWRKGGSDLPGQTAAELVFTSITAADAGSYDVVVSNNYGDVPSAGVTLTVKPPETTAPVLQYATGTRSFTGVRVWFSEPLDPVSAQTPSNYRLSGGVNVTAATLSAPAGSPGDSIVVLVTSAQTPGQTYTLTVDGVKDQTVPANSIAAGSTVQFSSWTLATGYLTFEHYDNITGAADTDIERALQDPRVIAGTPTTAGYIAGRFDTRTVFPDDSHEFFLSRMTGWITPTETADYYFFLRADDAARLYLTTTGTTETIPNPATDTPICTEPDCCDGFYEPDSGDPATTATPITLEAGKRYGVLALLKEHGGGDYLMVAWRKSTDTTPAASLPFLPGQYFATYVDPNTDLQFVKQPTDQPGVLPTPVVDFVNKNFVADDGGFTVENTDPEPPGPWLYDATSGLWAAEGSVDGCGGPYNSRLTSPAYVLPATDEVTLTFSHRYSFEADRWDGGQVRISVNGGAFTPVSPDNFTANGYPPGLIQGSGVLNGLRVFHEDSPGYANGEFITSSVILGSFNKNDTIAVQWLGGWDDCATGSHPSWVLKDVKLAYGTAARSSTFEAEATASKQGQPASFTYQWQRNDGAGFVDIPNENAATFRIFPVAADFDARFRVLAKVPGKELASSTVKLTRGPVGPPDLAIARSGLTITITFTGKLQSSATVAGGYTDVGGAQSPYPVPNPTGTLFFRSVN
ncbi:MAG: immunoglobulin domain-containing protein [Verrucomicrobia bacterium]|nr:immunoglobulin domain-containing protein [Verrucomicrobiota bacterium]